MPRMGKGGKFIFGKSRVLGDYTIRFPPQAAAEYHIACEGRVYLFTGSKSAGGFCVTRKGLLPPSKIGRILKDTPSLLNDELPKGRFVRYKSRSFCRVAVIPDGSIRPPKEAAALLQLAPGMELLSIRSSDIAFTMGARGPLLKMPEAYSGPIEGHRTPESLLPIRLLCICTTVSLESFYNTGGLPPQSQMRP